MTYTPTVTPTDHERAEWARLADHATTEGRSSTARRFRNAARADGACSLQVFDRLQADYRKWLCFGEFSE